MVGVRDGITGVTDKIKNIKTESYHVVVWFGAASVFGWVGHDQWHNSEKPDCFYNHTAFYPNYAGANNPFFHQNETLRETPLPSPDLSLTRPEECFGTMDSLKYMFLAVAIFMAGLLFWGYQTRRGLKGPLKRATWDLVEWDENGKASLSTAWKSGCGGDSMEGDYHNHIRRYAEFFHMIFAVSVYIVWMLIVNNDTDGVRIGAELPYLRHIFFLWIIIVPTLATSLTRQEINTSINQAEITQARKDKYGRFVRDDEYDIYSLAVKSIIYVTMAVFVDPQTQFLYPHATDAQNQKNVIIAVTTVVAFMVTVFWMRYHTTKVVAQEGPHDSLFAFNDFPVYITMFCAYAWSMTSRFDNIHNHPFTINYDFFIHTVYLWATLLGILNTPCLDEFFTVLQDTNSSGESVGLVVTSPDSPEKEPTRGKKASKFDKL